MEVFVPFVPLFPARLKCLSITVQKEVIRLKDQLDVATEMLVLKIVRGNDVTRAVAKGCPVHLLQAVNTIGPRAAVG